MKVTRLFVALGVVGLMGCAAADTEPTKKTEDPLLTSSGGGGGTLLTAPDCLSNNYQQHIAYARPHGANPSPAALTPYTSQFPTVGVPPDSDYHRYEESVWNIPRANGYMYKVSIDDGGNGGPLFFLVGIRDRWASPPYLMQPPAPFDIRSPWMWPPPLTPFAATDSDYTTEVNQAAAHTAWPIAAAAVQCVKVVDLNGTMIDYFVVADTHDPTMGPW